MRELSQKVKEQRMDSFEDQILNNIAYKNEYMLRINSQLKLTNKIHCNL